MSVRLNDFSRCEQILGNRLMPTLEAFDEKIEKDFADKHLYWKIRLQDS